MNFQKCPKCGSTRIRRGYKRTPLLMRLVGIYHLLCDHCNLLFTGFVLPGMLNKHHKKKHRHRKQDEETENLRPLPR
jgi:hypothetical protein